MKKTYLTPAITIVSFSNASIMAASDPSLGIGDEVNGDIGSIGHSKRSFLDDDDIIDTGW